MVAATVPMVWALVRNRRETRDTREAVEKVQDHLPPNGDRLFEMVQQTNVAVNDMQAHQLQLRISVVSLAEQLENHIEETSPMVEFVRALMGEKEGSD